MKRILYSALGVIVSLFALTSVASLGSYTNQSTNNLMDTQSKLQALQQSYDQLKAEHAALSNEYDQLKADNQKLGKDYDQSRNDLQAANSKIAALTGDVKIANDRNQALQQTLDAAKAKADILAGLFDDNVTWQDTNDKIIATGDTTLLKKWKAIHDTNSMGNFIIYLAQAILDAFG